jgi:hypothetical protein
MKVCQEIFLTCAVLHNMMLSEMVREGKLFWLQCGRHLASDGMWLEGPSEPCASVPGNACSKHFKLEFDRCCTLLSHHLRVWRVRNKNDSTIDLHI